jgi:xanthine dehydrogenase small subunit
LRDLPKIIWLGRVRGLDTISDAPDAVTFGATATHQAAMPHLAAIDPDLGALMRRFAGRQVRTVGTIGGNIANGSPIGDTPPALIALESTLVLQQGDTTRTLPLEDFFIAYGRQDRRPGEFVRAVRVRKPGPDDCFRCYKISKRFDSDISAVMGAFRFTRNGDHIAAARIAFGGMAATPRRAAGAEAALAGARLSDPATWSAAHTALDADFAPLDDQRGSARYRRDTARALLRKALIEAGGKSTRETRVVDAREDTVVSR